jgi:hypothetical protein
LVFLVLFFDHEARAFIQEKKEKKKKNQRERTDSAGA